MKLLITKNGMFTSTQVKQAEKTIEILKEVLLDTGYTWDFQDVDISLKGKKFAIKGNKK